MAMCGWNGVGVGQKRPSVQLKAVILLMLKQEKAPAHVSELVTQEKLE